MKIKRTAITCVTFETKFELLQNLRGCFDCEYNRYVPTSAQIEFIRDCFRNHLKNVGGYRIVSNGYGQMKHIEFDNATRPMNAKFLFAGIAAKLSYPLSVVF